MSTRVCVLSLVVLGFGSTHTIAATLPTLNGTTPFTHLDAGTLGLANGTPVSSWTDNSGSGNHATQGTAANQPTYNTAGINGLPSVFYDGNDASIISTPLNLPYTTMGVSQLTGASNQRVFTSANVNWLMGNWGLNQDRMFANGWVLQGGGATTSPKLYDASGYGRATAFSGDGKPLAYNALGLIAPSQLQIGSWGAGAGPITEGSAVNVSEFVAYNRVLTPQEKGEVGVYMAEKYGISSPHDTYANRATRTTTFTGADTGEGLDFEGDFHSAVNARGPGGFSIGDAAFTTDAGVVTSQNEILNWITPNFGGSADDNNLETVMESIRWSVAGNTVDATITGLTAGKTYKTQLLFQDPGIDRHYDIFIDGSLVRFDASIAAYNGSDPANGVNENRGVVVTHEFIAQGGTHTIQLAAPSVLNGDRNPILQGLTVEDQGVLGVAEIVNYTGADAGEGLDFAGDFVYAVNVGGTSVGTIGDANFTTDGVAGVNVRAENIIGDGAWQTPAFSSPTADDITLGNILNSIRWTATDLEGEVVSLDLDVTAGEMYKLQLLFNENGAFQRAYDIEIEGVLVGDNFGVGLNGADALSGIGSALIYEFRAGDDELNILINGFPGGLNDRNPILNAFTLELIPPVPEPSTGVLAMLGVISLGLTRRRRRLES